MSDSFTDLDKKCVNTVRMLCCDMIQKPKSGHPGAPMGMAPMAHVLWSRVLRFDPDDPEWINRDRFVLSNGHASSLLYSMLHLSGYSITEEELKTFRCFGSRLAGHPESAHLPGVEITTGPLGNGIAAAVGMAITGKHLAALYNKPNFDIINGNIFVFCGDGCMQEGVASEACSLAGTLGLDNMIVLYDDNGITIDGSTDLTFTEDVGKRFEAYGWDVQTVADGNHDMAGILHAIQQAKSTPGKPHLIKVKTTIGFGSKGQNTSKVHGSPLGDEEIARLKTELGFDPAQKFFIGPDVREYYTKTVIPRAKQARKDWDTLYAAYKAAHADDAASFESLLASREALDSHALLTKVAEHLKYDPSCPAEATRKSSERVLKELGSLLPQIMGGSADLRGSTLACVAGSPYVSRSDFSGRNIPFGIREHAMCAMGNGIAAYAPHSALIPYVCTFLVFAPYAFGAIRLAALSRLRVLYIFTHDSIGVGEDGPTHQPIETLAQLRAFPNLLVFRPADGTETIGAYLAALKESTRPSVLALSRQGLPQLEGTRALRPVCADGEPCCPRKCGGVDRGAYEVLRLEKEHPEAKAKECCCEAGPRAYDGKRLCLLSCGSELHLCVAAAKLLFESGAFDLVRVVSAPCLQLFDEQCPCYRAAMLGTCFGKKEECAQTSACSAAAAAEAKPHVCAATNCDLVMSVEASIPAPWARYSHVQMGIEQYGYSAPASLVYEQFHLTPQGIAERAQAEVKKWTDKCLQILVNE